MIVMGGIVGAGIFINPYVVAQQVHTPMLILAAWVVGGVIALAGAFVYAELAARMPEVGGQYAYLRESYHPAVAFLYGWVLYVVAMDFIFFGLTVSSHQGYRVPGHPVTTALFVAACWLVVANTIYRYSANSLVGIAILAAGVPVYLFWGGRRKGSAAKT